ncbi:CAP domain-containing protein [Actinomadura sp. 3N407]|uniref:CAP domain-containing protein n=1 Tax=Actinomadura sp. 3N407 TaxID=3457423 RepID=UPI003FCED6D9
MTGIVVAVTASGLAISTGVAIDRFLLPELRSERTSASGPDTRPSTVIPPGPQSDPSAAPEPGGADGAGGAGGAPPSSGTPTPTAGEQTPPLKAMRDPSRTAGKPSKPGEPPASSREPSGGGTSSGGSGGSGGSSSGSSGPEAAVVSLTNKERAKAGCKPLRIDQRLVTSARKHSADMAANGYFSHTSQNGDSPWKRMEEAGYPSPGAENIAKGYPTPAGVMKGWMNSPGHRANILNCDLRAIGVGKASGSGGPLWTQNFGWK